jgi:hypothetical protein
VKPTRLTKKEVNSRKHLKSFVNKDLLKNKGVSLSKFDPKGFQRGLKEGEAPFPV